MKKPKLRNSPKDTTLANVKLGPGFIYSHFQSTYSVPHTWKSLNYTEKIATASLLRNTSHLKPESRHWKHHCSFSWPFVHNPFLWVISTTPETAEVISHLQTLLSLDLTARLSNCPIFLLHLITLLLGPPILCVSTSSPQSPDCHHTEMTLLRLPGADTQSPSYWTSQHSLFQWLILSFVTHSAPSHWITFS